MLVIHLLEMILFILFYETVSTYSNQYNYKL